MIYNVTEKYVKIIIKD